METALTESTPYLVQDQLKTDTLQIDIATQMVQAPNFNIMLQTIQTNVLKVNQLLSDYRNDPKKFVEENDEEEVETLINELKDVMNIASNVDGSRKTVKKRFDEIRDNVLNVFDQQVNQFQFSDLKKAKNDLAQLTKDMQQTRANERWEIIREEFEAAIAVYPFIQRMAPMLTDFDQFRLKNPKLVSGAKTRKVTKKDKQMVRTVIDQWHNDLQLIEQNAWQLEPDYKIQLLNSYIERPQTTASEGTQTTTLNKTAMSLKERQDQENERLRKKLEEQQRLKEQLEQQEQLRKQQEELKKQQMLQQMAQQQATNKPAQNQVPNNAETQTTMNQPGQTAQEVVNQPQPTQPVTPNQTQPVQSMPTPFEHTVKALLADPFCRQLATNPYAKIQALAIILNSAINKENNCVYQDTQGDPNKVLDLVKYILQA